MDAVHLDPAALPFELISSDETVARVVSGALCALKPGAVRLTARLTLDGVTAEDSIGLCVISSEA